jgi:hypothetical protein
LKRKKKFSNTSVEELLGKIAEERGETFEAVKGAYYYIPSKKVVQLNPNPTDKR